MRKDMKRKNDRLVALLGAVLCACACLEGCERTEEKLPEPPASAAPKASVAESATMRADVAAPSAPTAKPKMLRADDAAYQAQLKDCIAAQRRTSAARERILAQMERLRARAKKALPANATDAQVTAEIENNPRKYPGWFELVTALEKNTEENKSNQAAARAMIRRRIQREVAEQTSAKQ